MKIDFFRKAPSVPPKTAKNKEEKWEVFGKVVKVPFNLKNINRLFLTIQYDFGIDILRDVVTILYIYYT